MNTRRKVLKALGLAPLAAPLAAKVAHDAAVADLMANMTPLAAQGGGAQTPELPVTIDGPGPFWKRVENFFLKCPTLPSWYEDMIRDRHKNVYGLDPDIAAKRSWSMSVKVITQRERNVQRDLNDLKRRGQQDKLQHEFSERFGIWI